MAGQKSRAAATQPTEQPTTEEKAKRTVLTPAQKVAKLEAELAEARAKAEKKAGEQGDKLKERRAKLIEQINERKAKVEAIEAELKELGVELDDHADSDEDQHLAEEGKD